MHPSYRTTTQLFNVMHLSISIKTTLLYYKIFTLTTTRVIFIQQRTSLIKATLPVKCYIATETSLLKATVDNSYCPTLQQTETSLM